ncbi:TylF/MycF/NovP-related O-methyltransferase [Salinispira pacifica]
MTTQGRTSEALHLAPGYERTSPRANYAPWLLDEEFRRTYAEVEGNTLVDIYRCYSLWQLVEQAVQHPGDLLEVGVWRGGTGAIIAHQANPDQRRRPRADEPAGEARTDGSRGVFLADTFSGVAKAGPRDTYYRGGEHANTSRGVVEELLARVGATNAFLLEGIFPEDTGDLIDDHRFCFCHIDVDVYQSARDVFEWVWPRLVVGGIVVYDDYGFYGCEGVTSHVNEIFPDPTRIVIHNLNGQAIVVKTA